MDFQFDDITRGRRIKILNVTDEFTREALAGRVARHITAQQTIEVLDEIVAERGAPPTSAVTTDRSSSPRPW